MAKRALRYSIVIICEGENTEPRYFVSIANKIKEEGLWGNDFTLTVLPKPRMEDDEENSTPSKHKTSRKTRYLKPAIGPIHRVIDREEYKPQPIAFVREAQLEKIDGTYDEAWAVFDYDHRNPIHVKAAFDLAQDHEEGVVSIAYSSVAFEHWYLLHFERNMTAFNKSECRIGREVLECNSGIHEDDCYGARCIGGYLRHQGYITFNTKGDHSLFPVLEDRLSQAHFNASWLRHKMSILYPGRAYFELNPYVDVDKLVRYLLQVDVDYFWHEPNTDITEFGNTIRVNLNGPHLSVSVPNNAPSGRILNIGDLEILDAELNMVISNNTREVINVGETQSNAINLTQHPNASFIRIKLFGNSYVCLEIQ